MCLSRDRWGPESMSAGGPELRPSPTGPEPRPAQGTWGWGTDIGGEEEDGQSGRWFEVNS